MEFTTGNIVSADTETIVNTVAKHEGARDEAAIARAVHSWGPNKQVFTERQVQLTARRLVAEGWLPALGGGGGGLG